MIGKSWICDLPICLKGVQMNGITLDEINRINNIKDVDLVKIPHANWYVEKSNWKHIPFAYMANIIGEMVAVCKCFFDDKLFEDKLIIMQNRIENNPVCYPSMGYIYLAPEGAYPIQVIYQFAHEIMHVYLQNRGLALPLEYKWIEESMCEHSSIKMLAKVDEIWKIGQPKFGFCKGPNDVSTYIQNRYKDVLNVNLHPCELYDKNKKVFATESCIRQENSKFVYLIRDMRLEDVIMLAINCNSNGRVLLNELFSCKLCANCKLA